MVAYEKFNYEAGEENEENPQRTRRNSRAYGLDLFVRDALANSSSRYFNLKEQDNVDYTNKKKKREQREYREREKKFDPLEFLASMPYISTYDFNGPRIRGYGLDSSSRSDIGYGSGEKPSYNSVRGAASGDYSSDGAGASYATADAGVVGSYSSN